MTYAAFLKVDGIFGECTDKDHKDWIELVSFRLLHRHQELYVTKLLDKSTPQLREASSKGTHIKTVVLDVPQGPLFARYVFQDVVISTAQLIAPPPKVSFPCEGIGLRYGKFAQVR